MAPPVFEIARHSPLKTSAGLLGFIATGVLSGWFAWTHPDWGRHGSGSLFVAALLCIFPSCTLGVATARAVLGGPSLFISDDRLIYLFPWYRSWPVTSVTAIGLQKAPLWGRICLRIEVKDERPLLASAALFRTSRREVMERCAEAGLPVRYAFAADGTVGPL